MNDKYKQILSVIAILFVTMLLVSGGTFAYLAWRTDTTQQTTLAINVSQEIRMPIENPEITDTGLYPTNNCAGNGAMPIDDEGNYSALPSIITIENQTGVIARPKFKLKVKITDRNGNVITNNASISDSSKPYRYYINYAIAEVDGSCTEPLFTGRFDQNTPTSTGNGWYNSSWVTKTNESGFPSVSNGANNGVSFNAAAYGITTHEYRIWAWLDSSYTTTVVGNQSVTDPMQDATISISWSEDSTVEQIHAEAYAVYSADDQSLRFYKSDEPITVGSTYSGRNVTAVYLGFETTEYADETYVPWYEYADSVEKVIFEDEVNPISTAHWFSDMENCVDLDTTKLDTSNVTNMSNMFYGVGQSVSTLNISGVDSFDTSNVTNMSSMFGEFGISSTSWNLDLSAWDVYKVTNYENFSMVDNITLPIWYTSYAVYSATDKSLRFYRDTEVMEVASTYNGLVATNVYEGIESTRFSVREDNLWYSVASQIQTVVVEDEIYPTNTAYWFSFVSRCTHFDLVKLNTADVTSMKAMFNNAGSSMTNWTLELSNWDVSNVKDMSYMFSYAGSNSTNFTLDISSWDVSNVTNMYQMFYQAGVNATGEWSLDLGGWKTSKVSNVNDMFESAGSKATVWQLDAHDWDLSSITNMSRTFYGGAANAKNFRLDVSSWNTSNVTTMNRIFDSFGTKVNNWSLDLSDWDVSKVTSMEKMFYYTGINSSSWSLDLSDWNTSSLTNMYQMFQYAGTNATSWTLDLSQWNLSSAVDMSVMFTYAGQYSTMFSILGIENWNVSNVENMRRMFEKMGATANWTLNLSNWDVSKVTNYTDFNLGVEDRIIPPNFN